MVVPAALRGGALPLRLAYVVKRYPRFSETFVVNELLAHEAAGVDTHVFALRPPADTHFQPAIARVRAPVRYLKSVAVRAGEFWSRLEPWLRRRPDAAAALSNALDADGVEVYQALELADQLTAHRVDHIHAHFATSAATVARLASLLTGIPYTFTAHAKDIYHESVNAAALEQKIADSHAVVTVSEFNVAWLRNAYPHLANKVVRVFNGLPLEGLSMRRPRSTPPGPPLVLAVGRLVEKKGFDDLVRACAILRDRRVDFRCLIVGGGELATALQHQVDAAALGDRVQLAGPLPSDHVVRLLREASALVAPCVTATSGDRDGMPTILLEAMACGAPCVATDVTGIPEIVEDRRTGLLTPEREPEQLAASIGELIADRRLAQLLAYNARRRIEQDFDAQRNASTLRQVFGSGVARKRELAEAI